MEKLIDYYKNCGMIPPCAEALKKCYIRTIGDKIYVERDKGLRHTYVLVDGCPRIEDLRQIKRMAERGTQ